MTMEFRLLRLDEMQEAARVLRRSFDQRLPWLTGLHTPEEDTWFFREIVFTENQVWGALKDGRIVGIVAFTSDWINQLYVLPEEQGQGHRVETARNCPGRSLAASAMEFQKNRLARQFYEARGFSAVQQTDGSGNEEQEPDVLYVWARSGV